MTLKDLLKETYFALSANKSRSFLTILGIVIGIASVITMVSIGQGAKADIESQIESLGSNLLMITPGSSKSFGALRGGSGSATTLVLDDIEAIEQLDNISTIAPVITSREQISSKVGTNTNTNIYGVDENYQEMKSIEIDSGMFLTETHIKKLSKVAIIGPQTSTDLFGEGLNPVGQKLRIKNIEFTIIGITESKGGNSMMNEDDVIYIPITTQKGYITGSDSVSSISVEVTEEDLMTEVQNEITTILLREHRISNEADADFTVINQADILDTMGQITGTMTLLLGAIAGISLLVGGIGIMNMMLTIVTERTREIGLRKSLGAKKTDISNQFLFESVALTLIGGIFGIILGTGASSLVNKLASMSTVVTISSILLAVGVSSIIGIVFGYYPARKAAKLNPIEALRYE